MKIASSIFEILMCDIKRNSIKNDVISAYCNDDNEDVQEVLSYVKKNGIEIFPYDFMNKIKIKQEVYYDADYKLFYGIYNGKKLYLSSKFKYKFHAKRYFNNLFKEQIENSPHKYLTDDFNVDDASIVFDIGTAEGIFALEIIDKVKKVYMFECDPLWIEALKITFKDYADKIEIVNKYVSDKTNENEITIDDFVKEKNLENCDCFIKMDIEGSEIKAVSKCTNLISTANKLKFAVCTYHQAEHEVELLNLLKDFDINFSKGYMIYYYDADIKDKYLRHGVLRATKKVK